MQPGKTLAFKNPRLFGRVGIVDGRLVHVAELQAHAGSVFQIDRGKQNHGFHLKKLAISASPSAWLFSG